MSDPNELNIGAEEPATEMEMSAQDLLALSPSRAIEKPEHCATPSAGGPPMKAAVTARARPAQPLRTNAAAPSPDRRMSASRVTLSLSVLVAAVTAGGALYMPVTPDHPGRSSSTTMLQRVAQREWSAATPETEGQPVRFANPFDDSEVFEFPPGTSEAEARAAVADVLMERAMERQDQLDARLDKWR